MFEKPQTKERVSGRGSLDVRRLAAVDLYGREGTRRRRRIVMFEFATSAVAGVGLGLWMLTAAGNPWLRLLGVGLIGIGCNYVALTVHALSLWRPGALSAELEGLDPGRELRRYAHLALWLVVPFLVALLAVVQQFRRREDSRPARRGPP